MNNVEFKDLNTEVKYSKLTKPVGGQDVGRTTRFHSMKQLHVWVGRLHK